MDFSKLNQRPCIPRNMAVYHGGTSSMAYMRSLEALLLFEMMKLEIVLNSRYNICMLFRPWDCCLVWIYQFQRCHCHSRS